MTVTSSSATSGTTSSAANSTATSASSTSQSTQSQTTNETSGASSSEASTQSTTTKSASTETTAESSSSTTASPASAAKMKTTAKATALTAGSTSIKAASESGTDILSAAVSGSATDAKAAAAGSIAASAAAAASAALSTATNAITSASEGAVSASAAVPTGDVGKASAGLSAAKAASTLASDQALSAASSARLTNAAASAASSLASALNSDAASVTAATLASAQAILAQTYADSAAKVVPSAAAYVFAATAALSEATTKSAAYQAYSEALTSVPSTASNYTGQSYAEMSDTISDLNQLTASSSLTALNAATKLINSAVKSLIPTATSDGKQITTAVLSSAVTSANAAFPTSTSAGYTSEAWKAYTAALYAATSTAANSAATGDRAAAIYKALQDTITTLDQSTTKAVTSDYSSLAASASAAIASAGSYTSASITTLKSALSAASAVTDSTAADTAKTAMSDLSAAVSGLVKATSLTDLSTAINTAKSTYQTTNASTNYASSTWDDFSSAYVYATSVLNNAAATADQISNATASLNTAYQALFGNGKDTYTSGLSDAISGGATLLNAGSGSAFDDSTTSALSEAITSAQAVLKNSASTPDELASASAAINTAISDLKTTFQVTIDSLDEFISTAAGISSAGSSGVTTTSYNVLSSALANAEYARYNDSNASTLASDTAKLTNAIWATVPTEASAAAYKDQLKAALSAAQSTAPDSKAMSGVSSDSVTNLKNAIQTAIATLNTGTTDADALQIAYNTVNFYTANLSKTGGGSISLGTGVYFYVYGTNNDLKDDSLESQATNTINASAGTITFGDASSISNLLSLGNGYTTTFTLPTALTTFFNSSDWQKYVTASYYESGAGNAAVGTGMKEVTSGGINLTGSTVAVLDTTKTTTLANAINTGAFQITTSVNSGGQTVFTVNSKVLGSGTTAAGYVFTLNLKTWSADTGTYLQRVTLASDASSAAVTAANTITVTAGATGFATTQGKTLSDATTFANTYGVTSGSSQTGTDWSSEATGGLATLSAAIQSAVPAVTSTSLTRVIAEGTNTVSGKLDSAAFSAAAASNNSGDAIQVVVTDKTTGQAVTTTVNSDGTFSASFGNKNGNIISGTTLNAGDIITAQVQRVSASGTVTYGTLGYLSNGLQEGQTPYVNVDFNSMSQGSQTLDGTITTITPSGTSFSDAISNTKTSLLASGDLNVYTVQVSIYNSDGSRAYQSTIQAGADGKWSISIPALKAGQYVDATTRVQTGISTGTNDIQTSGTTVSGLDNTITGHFYVPTDTSALSAAVSAASAAVVAGSGSTQATSAEWDALVSSLSDAQSILTSAQAAESQMTTSAAVTQSSADSAAAALNKALTEATKSTSGLDQAISAASAIDSTK